MLREINALLIFLSAAVKIMNDVSHVLLSKEGFHECLLPYAKVQAHALCPGRRLCFGATAAKRFLKYKIKRI